MFGEPAFLSRQRVQVIDQIFVVLARKRAHQVTITEYFGPDGDVVGNNAVAGVCKCLRHAGCPRESIKNSLRLNFLGEAKDVRQKLQF